MKPPRFATGLWTLGLLAVLLASCAPSAAPASPATATRVPPPSATPLVLAGTEQPAATAQATSRGDKLEASDPAGVMLAAGRPVLIEFFRFT